MSALLRRLSVRAGLTVFAALLLALLIQLGLGGLLIERELGPMRDRSVAGVIELTRSAFASGAFDGDALERSFGKHDDLVLAIYAADGRLLSRNRHETSTPRSLPAPLRERASQAALPFVYVFPPSPGSEIAALASVTRDGQRYFIGVFDAFSARKLRAARLQLVALAFFGFGAAGLGGGVWLAVAIRRRLRAMQSVVQSMARGELGSRLRESADDELGQLGADLNRMGEALADTIARLRDEQQTKRRMFADLTHELRTPLTSVLGYVESLTMREVDADVATRQRYVAVLHRQASALARLVEELGLLSQFECEGLALTLTTLDLRELAEEEVLAMLPRALERGTSLTVEGPRQPVLVSADTARLGQVLRNLLDNALRHTPPGSHVSLRVSEQGGGALLEVRDDGPGIAPLDLRHLGERFYRTDPSRARNTGGRGLGLSIARAIVESHGGSLELSSREGQGTCACIVLQSARRAVRTAAV